MDFGWTEEQRLWRRAVRDFAQKEIAPRVREMDTTEPAGGADILGGCCTRAVRDDDEWVFNGEKAFISGVRESLEWGGIHLILTRTDPDPAAGHRAFTFFANCETCIWPGPQREQVSSHLAVSQLVAWRA
jgi:alkylation response protein AidB-like acyl-CoA dehydrogenase